MTKQNYFVGLGHPRCGTGFTAHLLRESGLQIGHERKRENGIVSWCLAGQTEQVPWGAALGQLSRQLDVFCVARGPLAAMPSIVPETTWPRSYNFMRSCINREADHAIMPPISADNFLKAVLCYVHWFDLCLSLKPDVIYRVDVPADDNILSDYVGTTVRRSAKIDRNHKPGRQKPVIEKDDYRALPRDLIERLSSISRRLGYDADAQFFAEIVDTPDAARRQVG